MLELGRVRPFLVNQGRVVLNDAIFHESVKLSQMSVIVTRT